jgi:hypothetical protein
MTITIEIGLELEAELARQAAAHGVGIDAYAANLLGEAAHLPAVPGKPKSSPPAKDVVEAIERLKVFGKTHGLSLRGTTIRELRHEARPQPALSSMPR